MNRPSDVFASVAVIGAERYVVVCHADQFGAAQRSLGRWASHPELSFAWVDAARMSGDLQQQAVAYERERESEMQEFEELARWQRESGFFVSLTMAGKQWRCELFNSITHRPPVGTGATALEALKAAEADKGPLLDKALGGKGKR
jgi:hypothetical protein